MTRSDSLEPQLELSCPESELVLGLVYPVGTDYTGVQLTLENYVKRFDYAPKIIRLSEFIDNIPGRINVGVSLDNSSEASRINTHMTAGNKLCERAKDEAFLVSAGMTEISRERRKAESSSSQEPLPRRVHILNSLKRPKEVELLRAIYGSGFYLIGVFASEKDRLKYLTQDKNIPFRDAMTLMRRDQDEEAPYGQRSRDTFQLADVFIRLKGDEYKEQLERFLDLVFGCPHKTPEPDEHAMFLAYSGSLRSGQLSRPMAAGLDSLLAGGEGNAGEASADAGGVMDKAKAMVATLSDTLGKKQA